MAHSVTALSRMRVKRRARATQAAQVRRPVTERARMRGGFVRMRSQGMIRSGMWRGWRVAGGRGRDRLRGGEGEGETVMGEGVLVCWCV